MMRRVLILSSLLAALAGCGHSPSTTFLVLDPAPPAQAMPAYAGPPVRVPYLHLPVTIDRPEAVRQDAAGVLTVEDFARWSAPLALMARNTLIQDLTQRLPAGAVLPPDAAPHSPEVRIDVTVLSFVMAGDRATLDVSYQLVGPGSPAGRPMLTRATAPVAGTAPSDMARALSACLGSLGDELAARLSRDPVVPAGKRSAG